MVRSARLQAAGELGGPYNDEYVVKGLSGFEVVELNGGASSVPFDFRVVAERKRFENRRLEVLDIPSAATRINSGSLGER